MLISKRRIGESHVLYFRLVLMSSAHRIGQKREVRVLRLISSGTVEELVLARAQRKLEIDGKVIQAGKFDDATTGAEYEALLAKAFEVNADDDIEETNELDDDELNELLARGDDEMGIFSKMDRDRKSLQLSRWREGGHKGPLPPPLMQDSELPPFYRRDIGEELAQQIATEEEQGRGRRVKADVRYTDGLTDEQWLNAMENSDDDVAEAADRKRGRIERRQERKRMNDMLAQAEAEGKPLSTIKIKAPEPSPDPVSVPVAAIKGPKKRGRPSASATPSIAGDDVPIKKQKTGLRSAEESTLMSRLYNETNAMQSDVGEDLNQYFIKPVDRKVYTDYYQLITNPIAMAQIKKKVDKDPTYTLLAFQSDMHLLWDNARTYNQEGSWVYNAADDMQEFFDRLWDEEYPKLSLSRGADVSTAPSGTSTPMYKPQEKVVIPTKIRLNMGAAARRKAIDFDEDEDEEEEQDDEESEPSESDMDDDD